MRPLALGERLTEPGPGKGPHAALATPKQRVVDDDNCVVGSQSIQGVPRWPLCCAACPSAQRTSSNACSLGDGPNSRKARPADRRRSLVAVEERLIRPGYAPPPRRVRLGRTSVPGVEHVSR